jgi:hypothetical protein
MHASISQSHYAVSTLFVYTTHTTIYTIIYLQMRRYFYNAMMMTDDVETQRKGVVAIMYTMGQGQPRRSAKGINTVWKFGIMFRSLPLPLSSIHFCYDNHSWRPTMSILQLTADLFLRLRFKAHRGESVNTILLHTYFHIYIYSWI